MEKIRNKFSKMNPLLKGILFFLGGLLILLIIAQLLVTFYADDYAANRLKEAIQESSDHTYSLDFDDFSLNVFDGSANIENLRINADTSSFSDSLGASPPPKMLFRGTVREVDVSGINIFSAALGNELHISSVTISNPDISSLRNPRTISQDSSGHFSTLDSTIYAAISTQYRALEIGEFVVRNGHGTYTQTGDTLSFVGQLDFTLKDIRVDSASAQSGRIFITDDFSMTAKDLSYKLADSLNKIAFGEFVLSSETQSARADSIQLIPRYPRFEYGKKNGTKTDRIDLVIPQLNLKNIDYGAFIDSARFYASEMEINNARLEDFVNQSLPSGPKKTKTLAFVRFRNSQQLVKIDSVRINNSFISYSEYWPEAPQAGTVTFENLNATLYNVSNYPKDIKNGLVMVMNTRTHAMGASLLDVHYEFPMDTGIGFHKIKGQLNAMPLTEFNPVVQNIAFVRIDRGTLNRMDFDMTLTESQSNGNLIINYENLKISLLDPESMEQKGLLTNIKSFVANSFLINENNTPESGMKAGHIQFQRPTGKSIFSYWWKSLLSGIKDAVKK